MTTLTPDPAFSLRPSGNLARRLLISRAAQAGAVVAAALAVVILLILIGFTVVHGIGALSWSFLTGNLPAATGQAGGIGPALLGTAELALIAGAISVILGILTALFLTEFASPRIAAPVAAVLDVLAGLPTIVAGVFVYGIVVAHFGESGIAAAIALSMVMTPLVARATLESLRRVPTTWRDAAAALGVSHWRTVLTVILPGAASGITTAAILAVARGAGETAPLLFTSALYGNGVQLNPLHALPNLPLEIYSLIETGYPVSVQMAWGAAFLLMMTILLVNIAARIGLRRGERKRGL
jgi:phosphate transport system permease protein